jgi:hypothetical protein
VQNGADEGNAMRKDGQYQIPWFDALPAFEIARGRKHLSTATKWDESSSDAVEAGLQQGDAGNIRLQALTVQPSPKLANDNEVAHARTVLFSRDNFGHTAFSFYVCVVIGMFSFVFFSGFAEIGNGAKTTKTLVRITQITEAPKPLQPKSAFEKGAWLSLSNKAIQSLAPGSGANTVDVVRVDHPIVYLRYRLRWLELIEKVRLAASIDINSSQAETQIKEQLKHQVRSSLLEVKIITEQDANKALSSCHPNLVARVGQARPPFFNNPTGVHWNPKEDFLALESTAVIDANKNQCAKAVVDLRKGSVFCDLDVACFVR